MLTADTITDEQIRTLLKQLLLESDGQFTCDTDSCGMALKALEAFPEHVRDTARVVCRLERERCAEIFNARVNGH